VSASVVLLLIYAPAVFVASLLGGWLPRRLHMTHTRTQLVMSLVAGLMLGVAFFHLIPHATLAKSAGVDFAMAWAMAGLVFMLLLLRLFHFHQHDFGSHEPGCDHTDANEHSHSHAHDHSHVAPPGGPFTWIGLLVGLSIHTVVDGIALGAVMRADTEAAAGMLGLGVFLAILLHKPLDALSIETVLTAAGKTARLRHTVNVLFSLLCPLTAVLFWYAVDLTPGDARLLAGALAFSAGAFICIALGDLLPEIQFHSHDRGKLTLLFLVGIGMAWAIGVLEPPHVL
jgi:zinc and cadmium transporter